MDNSKSNKFFIELVYVAPQNAVDEKGKPVLIYNRAIELDEKSHKIVYDQMKEGKTDIFIPTKTRFMNGKTVNNITYVNLHNRDLIRATTYTVEQLKEEDVKKAGKPVLYNADGSVAKIN